MKIVESYEEILCPVCSHSHNPGDYPDHVDDIVHHGDTAFECEKCSKVFVVQITAVSFDFRCIYKSEED